MNNILRFPKIQKLTNLSIEKQKHNIQKLIIDKMNEMNSKKISIHLDCNFNHCEDKEFDFHRVFNLAELDEENEIILKTQTKNGTEEYFDFIYNIKKFYIKEQ